MKFIEDAYKQFHRLWSVQGSLFFAVFNGALVGLSAFSDKIDPWLFLKLNVGGYLFVALLRLIKQKPAPEVPSSLPKPQTVVIAEPIPPVTTTVTTTTPDPEAHEILAALKELIRQHPEVAQ